MLSAGGRRRSLSSARGSLAWRLPLPCPRITTSISLEWKKFPCTSSFKRDSINFRERVLGEKIGVILQKMHESKGIKFHLNASVESAEPSAEKSDHVGSIKLKDGKSIPADIVIMAVGIGPATQFLKESNIKLEKDGGIKVDKYLQVKGVKDVY